MTGIQTCALPISDSGATQNRGGCCGTLTLPENNGLDEAIEREKQKFLEEIRGLASETGRTRPSKETR